MSGVRSSCDTELTNRSFIESEFAELLVLLGERRSDLVLGHPQAFTLERDRQLGGDRPEWRLLQAQFERASLGDDHARLLPAHRDRDDDVRFRGVRCSLEVEHESGAQVSVAGDEGERSFGGGDDLVSVLRGQKLRGVTAERRLLVRRTLRAGSP